MLALRQTCLPWRVACFLTGVYSSETEYQEKMAVNLVEQRNVAIRDLVTLIRATGVSDDDSAYLLKDLANIPVKKLRVLYKGLVHALFYADHGESRVMKMWHKPPQGYPEHLLFRDPNNCGSYGKKPSGPELRIMLTGLVDHFVNTRENGSYQPTSDLNQNPLETCGNDIDTPDTCLKSCNSIEDGQNYFRNTSPKQDHHWIEESSAALNNMDEANPDKMKLALDIAEVLSEHSYSLPPQDPPGDVADDAGGHSHQDPPTGELQPPFGHLVNLNGEPPTKLPSLFSLDCSMEDLASNTDESINMEMIAEFNENLPDDLIDFN